MEGSLFPSISYYLGPMPLSSGTRLGPYEILAPISAGGIPTEAFVQFIAGALLGLLIWWLNEKRGYLWRT